MTRILRIARLSPIVDLAETLYLRWALREIDPMHPDVGYIVQRLAQLSAPIKMEKRA
jgi:hypothetical protein